MFYGQDDFIQASFTELKAESAVDKLRDFNWLFSVLLRLRPDLVKSFHSDKLNFDALRWLISSGIAEYAIFRENRELKKFLARQVSGLGLTLLQSLIYVMREDARTAYPLKNGDGQFLTWFYKHGVFEHRLESLLSQREWPLYKRFHPERNRQGEVKPEQRAAAFGVNLIGYAYGDIDAGEDLRMAARALGTVGAPFALLNFSPGADIPQTERSMAQFVEEQGKFYFNIFRMTALETARYYMENGSRQFRSHYNIGYWPWELNKWPNEWKDLTRLVNEIWVASRHTYNAIAPVSPVPVKIMPPAADVGTIAPLSRKDFGLPEDVYLFCFSFDFNSAIFRKNPDACLAAFQKAFPRSARRFRADSRLRAAIVIKTNRPAEKNRKWDELKKIAAKDKRVIIIDEILTRPELLALYKNCDCYLSLHRAEGFGRDIAEALLLGLHVVTTGYSGNLDYCAHNPNVDLVSYSLAPVNNRYCYGQDCVWAEADINHAARVLRDCAEKYKNGNSASDANKIFSLRECGLRYRQRLDLLFYNKRYLFQ